MLNKNNSLTVPLFLVHDLQRFVKVGVLKNSELWQIFWLILSVKLFNKIKWHNGWIAINLWFRNSLTWPCQSIPNKPPSMGPTFNRLLSKHCHQVCCSNIYIISSWTLQEPRFQIVFTMFTTSDTKMYLAVIQNTIGIHQGSNSSHTNSNSISSAFQWQAAITESNLMPTYQSAICYQT